MKRFKTNQQVIATITAKDSTMQKVIGTVDTVKNGFVSITTEKVMSKWSNKFKNHIMGIDAKLENVDAV